MLEGLYNILLVAFAVTGVAAVCIVGWIVSYMFYRSWKNGRPNKQSQKGHAERQQKEGPQGREKAPQDGQKV